MLKKAIILLLISCILLQLVSTTPRRSGDDSDESGDSSSSSSSSEESAEHHRLHKRSASDESSSSSSSSSESSEESSEHHRLDKRSTSDESSSSSSSSSESSEERVTRDVLLSEFLKSYTKFVKSATKKLKSVAKKFLKNRLVSRVDAKYVDEVKLSFTKFIEADTTYGKRTTGDIYSIAEYFTTSLDTITDFLKVLSQYSPQVLKEPNATEVLIQEALAESGVDDLMKEILSIFEDFYKSFGDKVRHYKAHLSAVERATETQLIDWYDQYKEAKGLEVQIKVLRRFFSIYETNDV
ncbi:vitellogenin-A1-like [Anastrepha obliqua]|uniref:vitellogenin-A1-like n=1 Tax=Anastrepha obliqua TaxID=95512 RepID=UPI0024098DBB|nr:vitellogenin-A1-like [Anastrepha obliqua]